MVPLPHTKIVPDDWQQRHAATIAATMRAAVRVERRSDRAGTRDATAGRTSWATPYIVYEGAGRVQSRGGGLRTTGSTATSGGREVTAADYLVAVPADATEVKVGDVVLVLSCPDSPALTDLTLQVADVGQADIAWQRNLGCTLWEPNARG